MGKRKSSKPMAAKKKRVLETTFQCLFCNHESSVAVRMDKKQGMGILSCKVCGQNFQSPLNPLSKPVDIYYDWVDACEAAQKEADAGGRRRVAASPVDDGGHQRDGGAASSKQKKAGGAGGNRAIASGSGPVNTGDSYEADDFVVDDEPDGEADFNGGAGSEGGESDDVVDDDEEEERRPKKLSRPKNRSTEIIEDSDDLAGDDSDDGISGQKGPPPSKRRRVIAEDDDDSE